MKPNTKVKVNFKALTVFHNREGKVVAKVFESKVSGHKRKYRTEYIVQFTKPKEWSYFSEWELTKI